MQWQEAARLSDTPESPPCHLVLHYLLFTPDHRERGRGGRHHLVRLVNPNGAATVQRTFPSIGSGAHPPLTTLCPASPSLAYLSLSTYISFPLGSCANGPPVFSLFHFSMLGSHRRGQQHSRAQSSL